MTETGSFFEIAVEGSGEESTFPDFDAWRLEIGAVAEILAAIDEQIHSQPRITWRLADLHHSVPTVALRPEWDSEIAGHDPVDAVMRLWFSAINDLRNGRDPEALGAQALDAVRKALRPIGGALRSAKFVYEAFSDSFDVEVANAISKIQFKTESAREDWEGSLDEVNLHNEAHTFRLYPAVTRRWITCEFEPHQEALVRSLLQKKVSVSGDALYRPKEMLPHRIRVKQIDDLEAGEKTPLAEFTHIFTDEDTKNMWDSVIERRNGW
tara:strand:+ start:5921 stop:6721 length:801 start_codon:yes stop_codon:yes gene_type:complete